jgi:hypothetical protein
MTTRQVTPSHCIVFLQGAGLSGQQDIQLVTLKLSCQSAEMFHRAYQARFAQRFFVPNPAAWAQGQLVEVRLKFTDGEVHVRALGKVVDRGTRGAVPGMYIQLTELMPDSLQFPLAAGNSLGSGRRSGPAGPPKLRAPAPEREPAVAEALPPPPVETPPPQRLGTIPPPAVYDLVPEPATQPGSARVRRRGIATAERTPSLRGPSPAGLVAGLPGFSDDDTASGVSDYPESDDGSATGGYFYSSEQTAVTPPPFDVAAAFGGDRSAVPMAIASPNHPVDESYPQMVVEEIPLEHADTEAARADSGPADLAALPARAPAARTQPRRWLVGAGVGLAATVGGVGLAAVLAPRPQAAGAPASAPAVVASVDADEGAFRRHLARADECIASGQLHSSGGEGALDHLLAAAELRADSPQVAQRRRALADVFARLGDEAFEASAFAEAVVHFQAALSADPGRDTLARKLARAKKALPAER